LEGVNFNGGIGLLLLVVVVADAIIARIVWVAIAIVDSSLLIAVTAISLSGREHAPKKIINRR
jgi:hypothetical protein